jgi:ubiquinone/menaquinone biosynthesis C-methylase UbiE
MTERFGCHNSQAASYDTRVVRGSREPGNYIRKNYFSILERVIELCQPGPGTRILDIGIGTGLLAERLPAGVEAYGIDISGRMLDQTRSKQLTVALASAEFRYIPFADSTFDRIVSTFAFHHVPYPEKDGAIREIDRVVRPGGMIVIADFMFEDERQKRSLIDSFPTPQRADLIEDIDDEYFTFIDQVKAVLGDIGYTVAHERGSTITWIIKAIKPMKNYARGP